MVMKQDQHTPAQNRIHEIVETIAEMTQYEQESERDVLDHFESALRSPEAPEQRD
jgi:hypothetical protein